MPRFSLLTMRFGHPETTHFTMLTVCWSAPNRTDPANLARTLFKAARVFMSSFPHAPFSDRKRCVFDPEIQQYTDEPESDNGAPPVSRMCLYSRFDHPDFRQRRAFRSVTLLYSAQNLHVLSQNLEVFREFHRTDRWQKPIKIKVMTLDMLFSPNMTERHILCWQRCKGVFETLSLTVNAGNLLLLSIYTDVENSNCAKLQ